MDQGNHSEEDGSGKSSSSEEDDTIDIMPSHSKVFVPSKEQADLWELFLKRGGRFGPKEWSKVQINKSIRRMTSHEEAMPFGAPTRNLQLPPIRSYIIVDQWDHIK